jgi:glutathione S-transferase
MHKWMSYLTGDVHPAFYPYFLPQRYIADEQQYHALREAAYKQIDVCLQLLDQHMRDRTYMVKTAAQSSIPIYSSFAGGGNP